MKHIMKDGMHHRGQCLALDIPVATISGCVERDTSQAFASCFESNQQAAESSVSSE